MNEQDAIKEFALLKNVWTDIGQPTEMLDLVITALKNIATIRDIVDNAIICSDRQCYIDAIDKIYGVLNGQRKAKDGDNK